MTKTIIPLPDGGYGLVEALPKPERAIGEYMYAFQIRKSAWEQKLCKQPHIPCIDSKEGEPNYEYWSKKVWMETEEYELPSDYEGDTHICTYALPAPVKEDLWEEVADIMRELSCSNLAINKCKSHYIIQKKTN